MTKFFSPLPIQQDKGLFLIRLILGFFMIYHGWEIFSPATMDGYLQWDQFKNNSTSKWWIYSGKAAELIAGLLLFVGWLTRVAVIIIAGTMAYIAFFVGHGKIWYEDQHPFLFVVLAAVFFFTGPGKFSVDGFIYHKRMNHF